MSEQGFQVDCSGMAPSTPPDPCIVVIFGVAGDLGRTTLVPALYALACQKLLPEPCAILGVARRDWDDATFRNEMRQRPGQQRLQRPDLATVCAVPVLCGGDFDASATYTTLRQRLSEIQAATPIADNVCLIARSPRPSMVALPTSSPPPPSSRARTAGGGWCSKNPLGLMPPQRGPWTASSSPWCGKSNSTGSIITWAKRPSRICWSSALPIRALNPSGTASILITSKSPPRSPKALARAPAIMIASGRSDMVQSHLMQLLCMTAMEPPLSYAAVALRNETVKVLQAVQPMDVTRTASSGNTGQAPSTGTRCRRSGPRQTWRRTPPPPRLPPSN